MSENVMFRDKLRTLEKLAELGGEDRLMDQTITKLLDYAMERHRRDLEDIEAKLHTLEETFGMSSQLFAQKFHRGELGDDEEFFRWAALVEMQRPIAQRLAVLSAETTTQP